MTHRPIHGSQHIGTFVGSQQRQYTLCLLQAVALPREQFGQERGRHFSQPGKLAAQLFELSLPVLGWSMRGILPLLARLSGDQWVLGQLLDVTVVNEQRLLGYSDRQNFANQLPRNGILIVGMADEALRIYHAIDDFRRVVVVRWER